jgi:DNA-binding NarL/FixJ family response regulator
MSSEIERGLVIEDQPDTQGWLVEVARSAFGAVDIAVGGDLAAGHAWLDGDEADVRSIALIDLVLPDGCGIELIRRMADRHPGIVPVVVSIYDDDAHLFDAIAAGAQGYLLKDEGAEVLVGRLREIANGEPPLSPSVARRILSHFHRPEAAGDWSRRELLTPRETEVLALLGRGMRIGDAAQSLGLTRHTVAGYVKIIYSKLNISSRAEAALEAKRRGLV